MKDGNTKVWRTKEERWRCRLWRNARSHLHDRQVVYDRTTYSVVTLYSFAICTVQRNQQLNWDVRDYELSVLYWDDHIGHLWKELYASQIQSVTCSLALDRNHWELMLKPSNIICIPLTLIYEMFRRFIYIVSYLQSWNSSQGSIRISFSNRN